MKELPYSEGTLFAVPLSPSGLCIGLVARLDGKGALVGYFFGPRVPAAPSIDDLSGLSAEDAIAVSQVGDLHLLGGQWEILGKLGNWNRDSWPVPAFGRLDPLLEDVAWRITYSDLDINKPSGKSRISREECLALPKDGLFGAIALEKYLTRLMGKQDDMQNGG